MASSSSSPSDPAFSSRSWSYHVFLSFRGEDTRKKFVGHLYQALIGKGIQTYKDDREISLGESIDTSVMEAIKGSQIAIVVFSENFADSSWCLSELVYITDCKTRGLTVVPLFYDVEPTVVRKQKQKYGEAFSKHKLEKKTDIVIASWRKALEEASNYSGDEFNSATMDESEFIKDFVNKISRMVRPLTPWVDNKLVGVEERMNNLILKMKIESDAVLMIGIWGVGGLGKTTLANAVYSEISWKFDCCCRVENIGEKSSKNGLEILQKEIICSVLKDTEVQVGSVEDGKDKIRDKLSHKKVLIVLDDVDKPNQLEALAGSLDWFGKGSRIIVTTRNVHLVLPVHKVIIHEVSLLEEEEATELLCKHAGLDSMGDYEQLSKEVVAYAHGLPLALKVIGSSLFNANPNEWKRTLAKLKSIPNNDIVGQLKISYDGLTKVEKELFLEIACFFRGEKEDTAMEMLDACDFHPIPGVKVLREKALITFSDGVFDMHDLVQEMGHHIVRGEGEHQKNPEKQRRVWKEEDVVTICAMDETTDVNMIEALLFKYGDRQDDSPLQSRPPIVANAKNLRWIDWQGDLASPLLTNFPQRTLCCLILRDSKQKQLWKGSKELPNLKIMELRNLDNLIMTPDFDGLPNIERLILYKCTSLKEVHPSIGRSKRLVFLSIEFCRRLKKFPCIIQSKNLKTLLLHRCSRLFKPSAIQQIMGNLLGNNMNDHTRLWFSQNNLTKLDLKGCGLGDEDMGSSDWVLPNLKELNLSENKFSRLDFSLLGLPQLKWLNVTGCDALVELKELPASIAVIQASYCESLERFGDTSNCKWLWKVSTRGGTRVDPSAGERLLSSMLQGNAIEDHFISFSYFHQIPAGFVGNFFMGKTLTLRNKLGESPRYYCTLHLPADWDKNFRGMLMRVVTQYTFRTIDITIKHEPDEHNYFYTTSDVWEDSDGAPEPEYDGRVKTYVGYVSFSSLRQTTSLNPSYNFISFSTRYYWDSFTAELVPRKSKDDQLQTTNGATNCSEFWDDKNEDGRRSFQIQHDLKTSVKIEWRVY